MVGFLANGLLQCRKDEGLSLLNDCTREYLNYTCHASLVVYRHHRHHLVSVAWLHTSFGQMDVVIGLNVRHVIPCRGSEVN